MAEIIYNEETYKTSDGVDLFCRVWKASEDEGALAAPPRAAVIIAHGLADHSGRFTHVGEYLANQGYAVYAYDHRGQGKSSGVRGHVGRWSLFYDDLAYMVRKVKGRHPGQRLFLIGHSMGGLIVLGYGLRRPKSINGIIASSPCLDLRMKVPPLKRGAGVFMSWIAPKLAIDTGIPAKHLCHDQAVVEAYKSDPIRYPKVTTKFYVEFDKAMKDVQSKAESFTPPVLFMPGGDDPICSTQATVEFYNQAKSKDKELKVWDGLYHEIFNEPEKEDILAYTSQWIAKRESRG